MTEKMAPERKNVSVVVLGDIGRSPRMQYHSLSLHEMGHTVDIIGYGETEPITEIKESPSIYYHYLLQPPHIPIKLVNYAFKTIWQALNLLFMILLTRTPDVIMVQNPPAIPALLVCWIYAKIVGAKFVIDWHNYAHTIMALNLHKKHVLVKLTHKLETYIGTRADSNFCVTNAMRNDLLQNWNIRAVTLHDKPPKIFKTISLLEKHNFLKRLGKKYKQFIEGCASDETVFTEVTEGSVNLKKHRPALLVSSTSWTEDEDFSILFSALQDYEFHCDNGNVRNLPNLICVITGKGHLKEYYCKKIAEQKWKHVTVITPWLEAEDYPLILASADLGVSLHTSSSGLDLPMKVVDMFGCGLPVCAYNFKCLNELVEDGKNGYIFKSSNELSEQLENWFEDFPNNSDRNTIERKFKSNLETFQNLRWKENWSKIASPIFS